MRLPWVKMLQVASLSIMIVLKSRTIYIKLRSLHDD